MPMAYILLNIEAGQEPYVAGEIQKIPGLKEAHRVYGVYDMIAKIESYSMDKLKETVTWKVRQIDGVRSTLTSLVMEG